MMQDLLTSEIFMLGLCLGAFLVGKWVFSKVKHPLMHPLLIAIALVILFLKLTGIDYETFRAGSRIIHFLLGPTVVALGYVLYEQVKYIKGNAVSILVSVFAGCITSVVSVILLSKLFGADAAIIHSMTPKSVTTPIALSLSDKNGGIPALTAISVVITGVFGGMIGPFLFQKAKITSKIARGLALGSAAHAVGTAKALELGAVEGAIGGLAIGLMGFMTAVLLPLVEQLFI